MDDFNINDLIVGRIYELILKGTEGEEIIRELEKLCKDYGSSFNRDEVVNAVNYAVSNIKPCSSKPTVTPEVLTVNTKGGLSERVNRV